MFELSQKMTDIYPIKEKPCGLYSKGAAFVFAVFVFSSFTALTPSAFGVVLATVDETSIHDREVNGRVQSYLKQIGHDRLSPIRMASLKKEVLKKLIEEELLYQKALKADLRITEEEIALGVEEIRQRFPSQNDYLEALAREALSLEEIEKGVSRSILVEKMWRQLAQMDDVTRANHLREMTQRTKIQVFEAHVPAGGEAE